MPDYSSEPPETLVSTMEMNEIARCLRMITTQALTAPGAALPSALRYFDDFRRDRSMYRGDKTVYAYAGDVRVISQKPTAELQPYAKMLGRIHHIYRTDLLKRIDITLDNNRLGGPLRQQLGEFDRMLAEYGRLVDHTRPVTETRTLDNGRVLTFHGPAVVENVPENERRRINASLTEIKEHLMASSLSEPGMLPVRIGGQPDEVANRRNLGLFLLGLKLSSRYQDDRTRMPEVGSLFLRHITGVAATIFENMNGHFLAEDKLRERYTTACNASHQEIIAVLQEGAHGLQVANLVHCVEDSQFAAAARTLLNKVDKPAFPDVLESSLECGLVLEALRLREDGNARALDALYRTFLQASGTRSVALNTMQTKAALRTLADYQRRLPEESTCASVNIKAVELVADFIKLRANRSLAHQPANMGRSR